MALTIASLVSSCGTEDAGGGGGMIGIEDADCTLVGETLSLG